MRSIKAIAPLFGSLITAIALAQAPSAGIEPSPPWVRNITTGFFAVSKLALLNMESLQDELKLTDAQKERRASALERYREKWQVARNLTDREKFPVAIREAWQESEDALVENLEPTQRARLEQIQLYVQGPTAFTLSDLPRTLDMSDDQIKQALAIVEESWKEIVRAAHVPLPWKPGDHPSPDAVRKLVKSPEFLAAKERAWREIVKSRDTSLRRIEGVLTERQLTAYRTMLGEKFDVEKLSETIMLKDWGTEKDIQAVAWQLDLNGQRADPDFDVKVVHPAYTQEHPSVLFDEAHYNFHTMGGRYKAFADLIANDGYRVAPNREKFTAKVLTTCAVLVVANALGAEQAGDPAAAKSAFTKDECTAVRDWVGGGGSLLLITDHQPYGSAAEDLAKQFGVDVSKGATVDPANKGERGMLFADENNLLGDHAITRGRDASEQIHRVLTFTGQSLKGPAGSVAFLKFSNTAVDRGGGAATSAAGRAQGVAFTHGKGRVVVLGEAAQLSAQIVGFPTMPMGMNVPGCDNRQMALNIMHWLSGLTK